MTMRTSGAVDVFHFDIMVFSIKNMLCLYRITGVCLITCINFSIF